MGQHAHVAVFIHEGANALGSFFARGDMPIRSGSHESADDRFVFFWGNGARRVDEGATGPEYICLGFDNLALDLGEGREVLYSESPASVRVR